VNKYYRVKNFLPVKNFTPYNIDQMLIYLSFPACFYQVTTG